VPKGEHTMPLLSMPHHWPQGHPLPSRS
jgi:hypothetical protein